MSLVTVICLCYNHAKYVAEAVESVMRQTYKHIELIIVNDASTDDSRSVIESIIKKYPYIKFVDNKENHGMCRSFNKELEAANGEFIIDLAADDILLPERIEKQVKAFKKLDASYGVVFTDAWIVNEEKKRVRTFYRRDVNMKLLDKVISGDVFAKVVDRYQICSPTIMVRKSVFNELGGYDTKLNYEDYDFYIRSSRNYKYFFLNEILTHKREVKGSDSTRWYRANENPHLKSTLIVLKKYIWLCKNEEEINASLHSIRYHMRQSLYMQCYELAKAYFELIRDLEKINFSDRVIYFLASVKFPLNIFYYQYRKIVHKK